MNKNNDQEVRVFYDQHTEKWKNLSIGNLENLREAIKEERKQYKDKIGELDIQESVLGGLICNKEIKEENTYEPFSFQDQLIGRIIKSKKSNIRALIVGQNIEGVFLTDSYSYKELLERFIFEKDGTPCGKKKESM
jgi:hypothetical protein